MASENEKKMAPVADAVTSRDGTRLRPARDVVTGQTEAGMELSSWVYSGASSR
jgi:hypothetical protein